MLNVTGVFPTAATHLSVAPAIPIPRQDLPDGMLIGFSGEATSNVNLPAGSVVPNLVTVGVNSEGRSHGEQQRRVRRRRGRCRRLV
ncbi:MAG: hypothetical protein R2699_03640 [Acidimicrobiales bacterium]